MNDLLYNVAVASPCQKVDYGKEFRVTSNDKAR